MKFGAIAAFVAGMAALSANAATFDFKAASTGGWKDSIIYDPIDGIGLEVSGTTAGGGMAQVATWAGFGLGVKSGSDCDSGWKKNICEGDDHQVDSTGPEDIAVFLFSTAVRITGITFNYVDGSDVFDLFVGESSGLTEKLSAIDVEKTVKLDNDFFSTLFGIGATDGTVKKCYTIGHGWKKQTVCTDKSVSSAFKITSITVEKQMPPVPLPASALLLVGALGGLGLWRRVSRKAA